MNPNKKPTNVPTKAPAKAPTKAPTKMPSNTSNCRGWLGRGGCSSDKALACQTKTNGKQMEVCVILKFDDLRPDDGYDCGECKSGQLQLFSLFLGQTEEPTLMPYEEISVFKFAQSPEPAQVSVLLAAPSNPTEPKPSDGPTREPVPTYKPTNKVKPTSHPTREPQPTDKPTNKPRPTGGPTREPRPTEKPTNKPKPTDGPTREPIPTDKPTNKPEPISRPTREPKPTAKPTNKPEPTSRPTRETKPTDKPTNKPKPTDSPTRPPIYAANQGSPNNRPGNGDANSEKDKKEK
jgi:hypothetical protein